MSAPPRRRVAQRHAGGAEPGEQLVESLDLERDVMHAGLTASDRRGRAESSRAGATSSSIVLPAVTQRIRSPSSRSSSGPRTSSPEAVAEELDGAIEVGQQDPDMRAAADAGAHAGAKCSMSSIEPVRSSRQTARTAAPGPSVSAPPPSR